MSICIQQCQLATMIWCWRSIHITAVASRMTKLGLSLVKRCERLSLRPSITGSVLEQDGLDNWLWEDVIHITCGYLLFRVFKKSQDVVFVYISLELNGNHARVSGQQATSAHTSGGSVCKAMHGQYGLLHAPSISACGIAWRLHCRQNRIYICKTNFVLCFLFVSTCT